MKHICSLLAVVASISAVAAHADPGAAPSPSASRFYPLVGTWKGEGKLSDGGQAPATLALQFNCRKAASGWAVTCDLIGRSKTMTMTDVDVFGVDPNADTGHWYAVDNQGDSHDHVAEWIDKQTLKAHYTWMKDGKPTEENVVFRFTGGRAVEFRSVVSQNGKEISAFAGTLKR